MGVAIRDTPKDSKPRGKSDRGNLKEIPFIFIAPCWQGLSRLEGCRRSDCRDSHRRGKRRKGCDLRSRKKASRRIWALIENLPAIVSIVRATADSVRCLSRILR